MIVMCINCNHEHGVDVLQGDEENYWFVEQKCDECDCTEFERCDHPHANSMTARCDSCKKLICKECTDTHDCGVQT